VHLVIDAERARVATCLKPKLDLRLRVRRASKKQS
jgi:hypothetical protein